MKKYHYIDDQGNISDALPLAALHKIGLLPATKVLIEGGKQWTTLAEATAGEPTVISPPPPPPPVAAPAVAAKPPPSLQDMVAAPFKRALADLNRPVVDVMLNRPEAVQNSAKPANLAKSDSLLTGGKKVLKGCLFFVIGFPILIGVLMSLVDRGAGRAKVIDAGTGASGGAVTSVVESTGDTKWVKAQDLPDGFDTIEVHVSDSTVVATMTVGSKRVWHTGTISSKNQASPTELRMVVNMKVEIDEVLVNKALTVMLTLNKFANEQDNTLDYFIKGSSATESVLFKGLKKK